MTALFIELCARYWPYLAVALVFGMIAGWFAAARSRV